MQGDECVMLTRTVISDDDVDDKIRCCSNNDDDNIDSNVLGWCLG